MFRKPTRPSLPLKKEFFLPLRLSCKESSTFLTKPLFPQGREDVTALRCSEPLRYKVGGPSKVFAILCGMEPHGGYRLLYINNILTNNSLICYSKFYPYYLFLVFSYSYLLFCYYIVICIHYTIPTNLASLLL